MIFQARIMHLFHVVLLSYDPPVSGWRANMKCVVPIPRSQVTKVGGKRGDAKK